MLELVATRVAVVSCFAAPEALDGLEPPEDAVLCRTADDEAMLAGPADAAGALLALAERVVLSADRDAVVLDATDGWAVWTLLGDAAPEAFARLSEVPLDDGFLQGSVAGIPARVIAARDRVHLLVPAMWRSHVRERVLADCASLGVQERIDEGSWTTTTARSASP